MKKLTMILAAVLLILSIGATQVFAVDANRRGGFVNLNNDGICDNRGQCQGESFTDKDADGICDNSRQAIGRNFTDENHDGICDNQSTGCRSRRHGRHIRSSCHS